MIANLLNAIGFGLICAVVGLYVWCVPFFIFGAFIEIEKLNKRVKALEEEEDSP